MRVSATKGPTRAVGWVLAWSRWYTLGIAGTLAAERRAELESDLYEHLVWAETAGRPSLQTDMEILGRAIRGVPADLSWRRAAFRADALGALRAGRRISVSLQGVGLAVSAVFLVAGLYALTRAAPGELASVGSLSVNTAMLAALTGLTLMGALLLIRIRTRFIGALWMVFPAIALIQSVLYTLSTVSTTFAYLYPTQSGVDVLAKALLGAGVALFFLAAALMWAPILHPSCGPQSCTH